MFTHYLRLAVRSLRRQPGYSFINIGGLGLGLACCLLLALYLHDQRSFDRFHTQAEQIYRIGSNYTNGGQPVASAGSVGPLAPLVQDHLPEVAATVRLLPFRRDLIDRAQQPTHLTGFFADSTVFEVFDFPLTQGDPTTALAAPATVVLSPEMATRFFGATDPVGQWLQIDGERALRVTGVLAPLPAQSHLQFDALVSMATAEVVQAWLFDNWFSPQFYTYVLLPEPHRARQLGAHLTTLIRARANPEMLAQNPTVSVTLEPLTRLYLHSDRTQQAGPMGDAAMLLLLGGIAGFILLIACINFINLTTARATERAREVGVRKAVGAQRTQLVAQFLGEAVLLTLLGVLVALALLWAVLPWFREFTGAVLTVQPWMYLVLLGAGLGLGVLAGSYPAFVLARFEPARVLKGRGLAGHQGRRIRQGLVVSQFAIAIGLMLATGIALKQHRYLLDRDPGFVREHMLVLNLDAENRLAQRLDAVKATLLAHPDVIAATATETTPGTLGSDRWNVDFELADGTMRSTSLAHFPMDLDFVETYGVAVVAGRNLSRDFGSDAASGLLVNEATVAHLGYDSPAAILGQRFEMWPTGGTVVGVVRNFNFRSLHQPIEPLTLRVLPDKLRLLTLRLRTNDLAQTLASLQTYWASLLPTQPFQYTFLDESLAQQYANEARLGRVFALFATLAVLLACLGLFGLATFAVSRRTKEIGIRKVVGATVPQVMGLLTWDFLRLVAVAFVLAVPLAYAGMQAWLAPFAYQVPLSWVLFAQVGLLTVTLAAVAVGYVTFRAASGHPVVALRSE